MTKQMDVLICGAGAAGLTLAIDLARRGVAFRIIDKQSQAFAGSRGKGIQPRSQEILEDLGVIDRIVAAGGEYPPQRSYRPDGSYVETPIMEPGAATPEEPYHIALLVPQFITERVLRDRLAELGHRVEFGHELISFEDDGAAVGVRVAGPAGEERFDVQYLVGADGGRSMIRRTLEIGFPGKTLGIRAVVADVLIDGLGRDAWHRWNENDMARQISLCPLRGTPTFQLQAPVPLEGDIDTSAEGLTEMLAERTGRTDLIVDEVRWGSAYTMSAGLADRYRIGRIFLAGDAAHVHPPTGGQGLNTSMQDAYNLGWKLAAVLGGAPDALLDSYEAERRPIAAQMLGLATRLLDAAKAGVMRRGREVHQLDIGYPESPLSLEAPERAGGLLAGDRAPDAPLTGAAGQPIRLFELMKGAHWTAIGHDADAASAPTPRPGLRIYHVGACGDLRDDRGSFAAAYALPVGGWVLIRPDGYIGAIVGADATAALPGYLDRAGLPALPRDRKTWRLTGAAQSTKGSSTR